VLKPYAQAVVAGGEHDVAGHAAPALQHRPQGTSREGIDQRADGVDLRLPLEQPDGGAVAGSLAVSLSAGTTRAAWSVRTLTRRRQLAAGGRVTRWFS